MPLNEEAADKSRIHMPLVSVYLPLHMGSDAHSIYKSNETKKIIAVLSL